MAVNRYQQHRPREATITVSRDPDFNGDLICDGVADEIQINAAIVFVNALGGGTVFLNLGTYTLASSIALLATVYLYGSGIGSILTIPAATDECIEINGAADWKIAFLTAQTTGAGANDAITLINADNGEIFSVTIDESGQDGIIIDGDSDDNNIHDNKITNCTRFGVNNSGDDNQIINNRIETTGDDGMFLQAGGTNNSISLNRISAWTGEAIDNDEVSNEVNHNLLIV